MSDSNKDTDSSSGGASATRTPENSSSDYAKEESVEESAPAAEQSGGNSDTAGSSRPGLTRPPSVGRQSSSSRFGTLVRQNAIDMADEDEFGAPADVSDQNNNSMESYPMDES